MTTLTLPWFPPAPAPAPISILDLPPDDWALEPKIDGIRVIWLEGRVYTRHGALLSLTKGAERLSRLLVGIDETLDGEWVPGQDIYVVFDLPDCPLDYDGRRETLAKLLGVASIDPHSESHETPVHGVHLVAGHRAGNFPQVYAHLKRSGAEGVVLKRRRSPYSKLPRPSVDCRDWIKRRFRWD